MAPQYGISTYGKVMLTNEGEIDLPWLRTGLVVANVLLYIIPISVITSNFLGLRIRMTRSALSSSLWLVTSLYITYVANNFIRTCHMVDHGVRPVYYHEPMWAYQRYIFMEMEVAFFANIVISLAGHFGFQRLLNYILISAEAQNQNRQLTQRRFFCVILNFLYFFGAVFNLVHYTIEPPWNYGPFPNFNIAGTAISAVPFMVLVVYTLYCWSPDKDSSRSPTDREQRRKLLSGDNSSVNETSSSGSARVTRSATKRSRTPIKGPDKS